MLLRTQIGDLFSSLLELCIAILKLALVSLPFIIVFVAIIFFLAIKHQREQKAYQKKIDDYQNSSYYQITKKPYHSNICDPGSYGEYITYMCLRHFENQGGKFLFNLYIPKENNQTTEIDVLMICNKGIFVFESKNYSGWIFGSETQINWYQTFSTGRGRSHKEQFYNPIMQNNSHIKHLKHLLGDDIPMHSIIVFSDKCTLKNIPLQSTDIHVINQIDLNRVVYEIFAQTNADLLSVTDISRIYNELYPYTQLDSTAKMAHIANIRNNLSPHSENIVNTQSPPELSVIEENTNCVSNTSSPTLKPDKTNEPLISDAETVSPSSEKVHICPNCGAELVIRTATRGVRVGKQFYGCSNFPKCKYIQNID